MKPITKDINVINHKKNDFCLSIRSKLANFPVDELRDYIVTVKNEFLRISEIKKTFYCNLCDAKRQMKIDIKSGSIEFNSGFCKNLITDYKDYIRFQNIVLIEYIDLVLQYIRCFQTSGKEEELPYNGFLNAYQNNFDVIHKCFDNINQPDFMSYCRYICQQYSYTTFSRFFDGNPELLDRVLITVAGFFRKLKANQDLTINSKNNFDNFDALDAVNLVDLDNNPTNEFGEAVETYGTSGDFDAKGEVNEGRIELKKSIKINRNKGMRYRKIESDHFHRKLTLTKNKSSKLSLTKVENQENMKVSLEDSESVYSSRKPINLFTNYRSVFNDDASSLNPLEISKKTNFNITLGSLVKSHERKLLLVKKAKEAIQPEVIKDYYSTSQKEIKNFTDDLDLSFAKFDDLEDNKAKIITNNILF